MLSSIDSLKIRAKLYQKSKKKAGQNIPLKDALTYIAGVMGYSSWKELKDSLEEADLLNPPTFSAHWKIWFANKEEALKNLSVDTFIIPYKKQFFICDKDYLNALGLSENDSDLALVGQDFSSPRDEQAFRRILMKIKSSISQSYDRAESR